MLVERWGTELLVHPRQCSAPPPLPMAPPLPAPTPARTGHARGTHGARPHPPRRPQVPIERCTTMACVRCPDVLEGETTDLFALIWDRFGIVVPAITMPGVPGAWARIRSAPDGPGCGTRVASRVPRRPESAMPWHRPARIISFGAAEVSSALRQRPDLQRARGLREARVRRAPAGGGGGGSLARQRAQCSLSRRRRRPSQRAACTGVYVWAV